MQVRHAKVLFCGASGAGKTSFCRLLKNIPLDEKCNSTGLGDSQQIIISEKAIMNNREWTELDPAEEIHQLKMRLKSRKLTERKVKDENQPYSPFAETSGTHMSSSSQLQDKVDSQQTQAIKRSQDLIKNSSKKVPEVEKCITSNYYNSEKQTQELPQIWDILTLLDTGGQPQFINMLPAVINSAAITFVVLNMAGVGNIFEERIQVHHFKNGIKSYEPYPLNYTNEDLIKCLVSLLKDSVVRDVPLPVEISKQATNHKPGLCFVGTHLDKVDQDTVDSTDEKLNKIVESLEPNDNIYLFRLDKMLFAVSNTKAGDDFSQDSIASKIRMKVKKMVKEKAVYEVPITWILLELEIRQVSKKQKRSFLPIFEVLEIYYNIISEHHATDNIELEVKAALQFHHTFGVLLYFHDVPGMNDFVISNPQWLFANLTNLVCCSFDSAIVDHSDIKKLRSEGILGINLIREINTDSLGGIDIEHFFSLLKHLKIVTPFPKPDSNDYLMLSILDSFKGNKNCIFGSLQQSQSVELLIQFKSGTFPRGIFCCLVVQLIRNKSEDWALQSTLNGQRCVYENLVVFSFLHSGHHLVLFDKVTHVEIQLRPICPEKDSESIYYEVQHCITEALKEVCSCMHDDLKYGFYCNDKKCLKPIMTLLSEQMSGKKPFPSYLQCEDHELMEVKSHKLWCKGKYSSYIHWS